MIQTEGGWGRRVNREMVDIAEELREMDDDDAVDRLTEIDGIGDGRAETILGALKANPDAIAEGNMEAGGPGIRLLKDTLVERVVENQTAPIDEPVTTDTHRLIRLPKTLHGGSGLVVQPIDREDLDEFDPLVDAVPEAFGGQEITIETDEPRRVDLAGDITKLEPGTHTVTEYVGVFLMARGEAEKVST
jgi:DNA primase small subunit